MHTLNGLVIHVTIFRLGFTTLNPNFEHVFIQRVSHGTKGKLVIGKFGFGSLRTNKIRIQPVVGIHFQKDIIHTFGFGFVVLDTAQSRQQAEFYLKRSKFSRNQTATCPTQCLITSRP
jgi:hypothetical protein